MSKAQKVVWTKGMFLMPQHFQAQDEYFEETLHFRAITSNFANWGLSRIGIDETDHWPFRHRRCSWVKMTQHSASDDLGQDPGLSSQS
jgi:Bacterial Type VI secretion, VC_A0110, EvfL, ImpJ, VasE